MVRFVIRKNFDVMSKEIYHFSDRVFIVRSNMKISVGATVIGVYVLITELKTEEVEKKCNLLLKSFV